MTSAECRRSIQASGDSVSPDSDGPGGSLNILLGPGNIEDEDLSTESFDRIACRNLDDSLSPRNSHTRERSRERLFGDVGVGELPAVQHQAAWSPDDPSIGVLLPSGVRRGDRGGHPVGGRTGADDFCGNDIGAAVGRRLGRR